MSQFLDISLNRAWRLIIVKHDIREEHLVSEDLLGAALDTVAGQGTVVQHVQCVPVYNCAPAYNFAFYGGDQPETTPARPARTVPRTAA